VNLDDDLKHLFTDDRLDIPVRAGATESVVLGARRRRNRRVAGMTAAGALTAVLAVGGVALAGGTTDSAPIGPAGHSTTETTTARPTTTASTTASTTAKATTTTPTTTTTLAGTVKGTTTTTPPAKPSGPVVGPFGLGALKLGMDYGEAVASGVIVPDVPPSADRGCEGYDLVGYPNGESEISVYAMHDLGIAAIFLQPGMRTPEGIGLGSSVEDFQDAYGLAPNGEWQAVTAVPGNPDAIYHMVASADGTVGSLVLALRKHECFG
jgi:hypothetical protein